jgi:hydroxymethylpyrimidine/phosphomethylpyrimidine kinase
LIQRLLCLMDEYPMPDLIIDPVMSSSSQHDLFQPASGFESALLQLLPRAALITPNRIEALRLAELSRIPKPDQLSATELARQLRERFGAAILLKGGHDADPDRCTDILDCDDTPVRFEHARIETSNLHGTGCTLSAAITALRAQGHTLLEATQRAVHYVQEAIIRGRTLGLAPHNGPLAHFPDRYHHV